MVNPTDVISTVSQLGLMENWNRMTLVYVGPKLVNKDVLGLYFFV